ncbi:MBL fold metallo-hydrolase [Streptomyces sp. adm13(2018)]|uniref:MBL fold metallo-hydrolase n=1 Tax=Streptomyces sp. adm13(2018) TaxID=2479007 RepID=UPI0011CE7182|nr:MBL fold metallo-hydrolase [Streptomyces sp. adm13(2018)]TXS13958.1 MBL fold metallo-hydrolase [Streptomyces sp. adm13(2018)]
MSDRSLRLTVLGSATPFPRPGNACSGYLVEGGGVRLWVDAGTGTLAELQRHVAVGDIDAVWISHLHADHSADLLTYFYALLYAGLEPDLPVRLIGPVGIGDRLARFLTGGSERSPVERAFGVEELCDGHVARVGGLTLTSRAVEHGPPAFALRVQDEDGRSLVYSGDCEPCPSLVELARDCDLFLCEADGEGPGHHSAAQAGGTAAAAGVGRLVLTHVGSTPPAPGGGGRRAAERVAARAVDRALAEAGLTYAGEVAHADPGLRFDVGADSPADPLPRTAPDVLFVSPPGSATGSPTRAPYEPGAESRSGSGSGFRAEICPGGWSDVR